MTEQPYDPANPPADPPEGCADPLLWTVAHALRRAHRPRPDNFCECKNFWPCPVFQLAEDALHTAYERPWGRPSSRSSSTNIGRWPE